MATRPIHRQLHRLYFPDPHHSRRAPADLRPLRIQELRVREIQAGRDVRALRNSNGQLPQRQALELVRVRWHAYDATVHRFPATTDATDHDAQPDRVKYGRLSRLEHGKHCNYKVAEGKEGGDREAMDWQEDVAAHEQRGRSLVLVCWFGLLESRSGHVSLQRLRVDVNISGLDDLV